MEKGERIEAKREELEKLFAGLTENKKKIAGDLISQAAFLGITLEDLAESINKNGTVEEYTNGANQSGRKVSSDAKLYSNLIAKYSAIITKLIKLAPEEKGPAQRIENPERNALSNIERDNLEREIHNRAFSEYVKAITSDEITPEDYADFMKEEEARQREKMAEK